MRIQRQVFSILFLGLFLVALGRASVVTVNGFTDKVGSNNCSNSGPTRANCSAVDVTAMGDLSTGLLGIHAVCCALPSSTGQSGGNASYSDKITLVLPDGYVGSTVPFVTMHFAVSNPIVGAGGLSPNFAAKIQDSISLTPHFSAFYNQSADGCIATAQAAFCGTLPNSLDLTVTVNNIPTSDLALTFLAHMDVIARGIGSNADALDPGEISLILPAGIGFTSESGVLLEAPEPASLLLLFPVMAGFVAVRRRR